MKSFCRQALCLWVLAIMVFVEKLPAQTVNENKTGFSARGATSAGYLIADVQSGEPERVRSALAALKNADDGTAQQVIEAAIRSSKLRSQQKRDFLKEATRRGKQLAQDIYLAVLRGNDDSLKGEVLKSTPSFGRDFAMPVFQVSIKDKKSRIRLDTLKAVSSMDNQSKRETYAIAAKDSDVTVRSQVAGDAGRLPQAEAWEILQGLCRDSNTTVRTRARGTARALGIDLKANGITD
ncbi:MAG: hypothetical protein AB1405_01140 [Bdellovibrionota bacterium]